jgi:hypothetical protein
MLNGKSKIVILALSLFFSVVMVCFCCILVIHFVTEFAEVSKRQSTRKNQDVLWAGFGISLFVIFAFAFIVFAVFSSCGMLYIIQCSTKIAPAPLEAGD